MGGTSPCASCKLLRRRCAKDCIFAPYFPSDDPHKFAIVHKVFGASNVSKMLQVSISLSFPKTNIQPLHITFLSHCYMTVMWPVLRLKLCKLARFYVLIVLRCTGASASSERRCCEQLGVWSKCKSERPGLRLCWCYIFPAESSFESANAARGGSGWNTLHPDATRASCSDLTRIADARSSPISRSRSEIPSLVQ